MLFGERTGAGECCTHSAANRPGLTVAHFGFSLQWLLCVSFCLFAAVAAVVTGIVDQELEPELLRRKLLREYSRVTAIEQTCRAAVSE